MIKGNKFQKYKQNYTHDSIRAQETEIKSTNITREFTATEEEETDIGSRSKVNQIRSTMENTRKYVNMSSFSASIKGY